MPMGIDADALRPLAQSFRRDMHAAGRTSPQVVVLTALALTDPPKAAAQIQAFADAGATGIVHGWRYEDAAEFARAAEKLAEARSL
jgi:hypothetical protein